MLNDNASDVMRHKDVKQSLTPSGNVCLTDTMNQCQICKNGIHGKNYCKSCLLCFIKQHDSTFSGEVKGGGEFIDDRSKKMGESAENKFYDICRQRGYLIRSASRFENTKKHYDFVVKMDNSFHRVEVKSMKARQRGQAPDSSVIYLELFNIDGGPGWIYGDADYIAFEHSKGFMLYKRSDLLAVVNYWKDRLPFVSKSGIDFTLYGRQNRKDLVLVLPFAEINQIPQKIYM